MIAFICGHRSRLATIRSTSSAEFAWRTKVIAFAQTNDVHHLVAHVLFAVAQSENIGATERGFIARVEIAAAAGMLN